MSASLQSFLFPQSQKSRILQLYQDQIESFHHYFKAVLKHQRMEDIHQMRVNIKKLRTQWSMMQEASKGTWKKKSHSDHFSDLFRIAGVLRESQVNRQLVEPHQKYRISLYTRYLTDIQNKAEKRLIQHMSGFDMKRLKSLDYDLYKAMHELSDQMILRSAASLALKKTQKVLQIQTHLQDHTELHKIRIEQKAIYELLDLIGEINPKLAIKSLQKQLKSINSQLGSWHDYSVLYDSFRHFIGTISEENVKNDNLKLLEKIHHVEQKKREKLIRGCVVQGQLEKIGRLVSGHGSKSILLRL